MISVKEASMVYDNGCRALNKVTFRIEEGEFVFLVGASGSGKSTIIKMLTAEVRPVEGRVLVNNFNIGKIKKREIPYLRRTLGVVYQDFRLIENKTVYENVAFAMRAIGASGKAIKNRVPYVLELVGLIGKEDCRPVELSGGEQQRVAIARALVNNPRVIIADEPTGNLDPERSLELMVLFEKINELGTTVLIVTHAKELVDQFGKRVIMINKGEVASDQTGGYTRMKKSSIGYFLKEGFRNIFLHGFMSFAAVSVIVVCLIITGTTALISYDINLNIVKLQNESEIVVYIEDTYTTEEARDMEKTILQVDNVAKAEFEDKDTALEAYREELDENADLLDGFDSSNNPLRDAFHITMKDPSKVAATKAALESVDGIGNAVANEEVVARLIQLQRMFQAISVTLVVALGLISIFIIANTVKLAMLARRREISIQKMVGATNWFIRWPFVIEGLVLGLLAGAIAFGLEWALYEQLSGFILDNLPQFTMAEFQGLMFYVLGIFAGAGVIVGVGGSSLTIRRFMDV